MATLGSRIRAVRNGRSLREAAEELGISVSALRNWEADFGKPDALRAEAIAAWLTKGGDRCSKTDVLQALGVLEPDEKLVRDGAGILRAAG